MDSRDSTRPQPTPSPFREAVFAGTASSPSDTLLVLIPDFGDQPFGDPDGVVWSPMGGALPQAGDRALVAESDDGSWWVVQWWSSNQGTGVAESEITALTAAIDAVPRIVRGVVTSAGAVSYGSGFTAAKNATGDYTVTFTVPFDQPPVVTFTSGQPAVNAIIKHKNGVAPTASAFSVFTLTTAGAGIDQEFHFIAVER